jgi:hypothetical protein
MLACKDNIQGLVDQLELHEKQCKNSSHNTIYKNKSPQRRILIKDKIILKQKPRSPLKDPYMTTNQRFNLPMDLQLKKFEAISQTLKEDIESASVFDVQSTSSLTST